MLHVQTEHWFACQVARQPPTHPASRDWTKAEKAVIMEEARASLSHYMPLRGRGSRRQHGWLDRFKAGSIPVTATSTKLHVQEEVRRLQGEKGGRQGGGGGLGQGGWEDTRFERKRTLLFWCICMACSGQTVSKLKYIEYIILEYYPNDQMSYNNNSVCINNLKKSTKHESTFWWTM